MDTTTTTTTNTSTTTNQPTIYHFKILVPAAAAGRIIGKGGTTIAQLQKDAGARVKMSKASEFYPGTTERVCLISGPIDGILKINDFFMENFSSTSIKILVPNSTAGMIIGKGGSYIKQIKEESGAYVQISQKCTDLSLPERCVTIVGELENIRKACAMILSKIVEDVGSAYRDIRTSSITNSMLTQLNSSPLAPPQQQPPSSNQSISITTPNHHNSLSSINSSSSSSSCGGGGPTNCGLTKSLTPDPYLNHCSSIGGIVSPINGNSVTTQSSSLLSSAPAPTSAVSMAASVSSDMNSAQIIESIKLVLRVSGYGEDAVFEITSAMSTLASYGVLGVGLGLL